jgi:hypothetical protein
MLEFESSRKFGFSRIGVLCLMWQDIAMLKTSIWRTSIFSAFMLNAAIALSSTNSISGTVKDSEGAAVRGARIMVHLDSLASGLSEGADIVTTSDTKGQFKVEVAPGFYDVFVSAPAFSPQCTKVRVRQAEPAIYIPRLRPDPLVAKERGDTF